MARHTLGLCLFLAATVFSADRLTLTGTVTNAAGKPLEHATVMVYHAGVKQGDSTFCSSCYNDCGKRIVTGRDGKFVIPSLSPDLFFELFVVRDGYLPTFVNNVDPANMTPTAVLNRRDAVMDPNRVIRGVVINTHGRPLRDAVVQPQGIQGETPDGRQSSMYGTIPGLEPVAVTNEKGEFELAHIKPFEAMMVQVAARHGAYDCH